MNRNQICLEIISEAWKIKNVLSSYGESKRSYGSFKDEYFEQEVHTLKEIVSNPSITISDLALETGKSKSSISQIINRLICKNLLEKVQNPTDKRKFLLVPTKLGVILDDAHLNYDMERAKILSNCLDKYSIEEIQLFLEILKVYHNFTTLP